MLEHLIKLSYPLSKAKSSNIDTNLTYDDYNAVRYAAGHVVSVKDEEMQ